MTTGDVLLIGHRYYGGPFFWPFSAGSTVVAIATAPIAAITAPRAYYAAGRLCAATGLLLRALIDRGYHQAPGFGVNAPPDLQKPL
jgi:hypothetical protein